MFTFVPQFLIIISIVGIIVIVLRRTPEVTGLPIGQLARRTGATIKKGLAIGGAKLWEFVLEVKEVSKKGAVLKRFPQSFPKNFPLLSLSSTCPHTSRRTSNTPSMGTSRNSRPDS